MTLQELYQIRNNIEEKVCDMLHARSINSIRHRSDAEITLPCCEVLVNNITWDTNQCTTLENGVEWNTCEFELAIKVMTNRYLDDNNTKFSTDNDRIIGLIYTMLLNHNLTELEEYFQGLYEFTLFQPASEQYSKNDEYTVDETEITFKVGLRIAPANYNQIT